MRKKRVFAGAVLALAITLTGLPGRAAAADPVPRPAVSSDLLSTLAKDGTASFLVYLRERADLGAASRIADKSARTAGVYRELTGTAAESQRGLRALLDGRKASYQTYWITNAVRVTGDRALLDAVAARADVERIEPVHTYDLVEPVAKGVEDNRVSATEWGVADVNAPQVWDEFEDRGEGIVVANVDTGVDVTHPALTSRYRGTQADGTFDNDYNWFDPTGICGATPCDNNDHGTHTMGTMVGDDGAGNQVGVAPGATFIAAKGCEVNTCSETSLLAAGQWILAPTDGNGQNPRPDLRPDIVNNSWGGGRGDVWYQETVRAWVAAGIFTVFSAGNNPNGATCNSVSDPAEYPEAYAVGAYDSGHAIGYFSLLGTSAIDGAIKPDIAAPGVAVRSSVPGGGYDTWNGTSMAAPHVAATVALIWSAAPSLRGDIAATRALLDGTAVDTEDLKCGGTAAKNNVFGEGRLDAYQAVLDAPRGAVTRASGTVTDADTGDPIEGATVTVDGWTAATGSDGKYRLAVEAGAHEVTAVKYGYVSGARTVDFPEGGSVVTDFALDPAEQVTVAGTVTDGSGHGWPLAAKVTVAGRPGEAVTTDPVTGRYELEVPENATYSLTATPAYPGYRTTTVAVEAGSGEVTADVSVPVDAACDAAGYSGGYGEPLFTESFDGTSAPEGWQVVNRTDEGGWSFADEAGRGNSTGGSGGFAIVDSDRFGSGKSQDTDLITRPLDLTGLRAPVLRFKSDFWALGSPISVDVSVDGGASWVTSWQQTESRRGPRTEEVSIASAAGVADALVRFRYRGSYSWFWEVDDVQVLDRTCSVVPGGLVVGTTTDANTGSALPGVTVGGLGESGSDGFYWLFSGATGPQPLTAVKAPYTSATQTVTIVADAAVRADYSLTAGRLTLGSTSIEAYQVYGSTRTATVTVKNTGTAPATIESLERPGRFEALRDTGTAAVAVPLKGLTAGMNPGALTARGSVPAPAAADAWTTIASLPVALFDNAAITTGGKVYSIGGSTNGGYYKKAYAYDSAAGTWTTLPDMPSGRAKPALAAIDGKVYAFGGWATGGAPVTTVDVFDIAAGTWSTLAATNPKARAAAGVGVIDNKVYLVGGCVDGECAASTDVVVFDPATGTFGAGPAYPHSVSWTHCGAIGAKLYCAGGLNESEFFADTRVYDADTATWTTGADMPVDVFGAQAAAAGGLLVLAGGAADDATVLTSQTIGYDPAADEWVTLPAMAEGRYRGAGACGAYRLGGVSTAGVGTSDAALLDGLGDCDVATGDVTWLAEDPASFVLQPGATQRVKVTLTATAAAGVLQPGTFDAQLALTSDTPYPVPAIGVTMTVSPPATWGKLTGTVVGVSCAGVTTGVPATVRLNGAGSYTLTAAADGTYSWWVPRGAYQVIVAKDGWVPEVATVRVSAGFEQTADFSLEPVVSCELRERALLRNL